MELRELTGPNGQSVRDALKTVELLMEDREEEFFALLRGSQEAEIIKGLVFSLWIICDQIDEDVTPQSVFESIRQSVIRFEVTGENMTMNRRVIDLLIAADGPASSFFLKVYSVQKPVSLICYLTTLIEHIAQHFRNTSVEELSEDVLDYMQTLL